MVRIAPVRLSFNPKTLWFDAGDLVIAEGQPVVVSTSRGTEFGHLAERIFDMTQEDVDKLDNPLKPVLRLATDQDIERNEEVMRLAQEALPIYKRMAYETNEDMHPVAVEYLFDSDKAIFYFEAEDRVDFRDLVKKLASEFKVRVDMKQIGVRDGARIVGGLGHCGQEICCRRLGGEFNPVSIRMAKEQDLSLNPQKISGLCGRLLCCLRYEFEAYKDFHSRAPKKNATIKTPEGEGKVVDLDVPREIISIKVGDEKPVKIPLADMEPAEEGKRPHEVGQEAWDEANIPESPLLDTAFRLFDTSQLSGEDKLAEPGMVSHLSTSSKSSDDSSKNSSKSGRKRRSQRGLSNKDASGGKDSQNKRDAQQPARKQRRRSTTVTAEGASTTHQSESHNSSSNGEKSQKNGSSKHQNKSQGDQKKVSQVGRKSSGLRARKDRNEKVTGKGSQTQTSDSPDTPHGNRRRRRSHHSGSNASQGSES